MTTRSKFPITREGYDKMYAELTELITVKRPAVIKMIAEARAHGDLSENAEYSAAKELQGLTEMKITYLETCLARAEIIDVKGMNSDRIQFGATVEVEDSDSGKKIVYKIASEYEADLENNIISIASPLAQALISHNKGEEVEVTTPRGLKYYYIVDVKYV